MELLSPRLDREEVTRLSPLALAHIGDGVYELMVRTHLANRFGSSNEDMHLHTLEFVSATAQAEAFESVKDILLEGETEVFRRGRNAHSKAPKHTPVAAYHAATGLEALFGYLWLSGRRKRLEEIFAAILASREADGGSGKA